MPSENPIQVAIAGDITHPDIRDFIRGVGAFVRCHTGWEVRVAEPPLESVLMLDTPRRVGVDGILADFDDPRVVEQLVGIRKPIVAFGGDTDCLDPKWNVPFFYSDNETIGRMAANHLVDAGYRHFAFCGFRKTRVTGWSGRRAAAFRSRLAELGYTCREFLGPVPRTAIWSQAAKGLTAWLATLPRPCGLMACNDVCGLRVLDALHRVPATVPDEFGVVGVDNDEMLCELAMPPLSSIEQGYRSIGFRAAAMLDRILAGEPPQSGRQVVPPSRLVVRASSDITLTGDPVVTDAVRFIRRRAGRGLGVPDVVRRVSSGRAALDLRFKRHLGHTIQAEIENVRLARIQSLLENPTLSIKEIAFETGFRHASYLTAFFRKKKGMSPTDYRKRFRTD